MYRVTLTKNTKDIKKKIVFLSSFVASNE